MKKLHLMLVFLFCIFGCYFNSCSGWTVEYTDGSNKELYFETERYSGVPDGHTSPGYSGTPTRDGYVFVGWNPKETNKVTSDITYVAQWKPDTDGDGIADAEENVKRDSSYSKEFNDAYEFAYKNAITTMKTIDAANMNGGLTRVAMAKMLSQYAINILGKNPNKSKNPNFIDITKELDSQYDNGVTLAYQLGIMGIGIDKFRPYDFVTRAEFGTALSRMLYGTEDGTDKYYTTHLNKLRSEGIITNMDPKMKEKRGYVMIMLMRSAN